MRCFLLFVCVFFCLQAYSQSTQSATTARPAGTGCRKNSSLYWFDRKYHPIYFTEKLGRHPQFPFLQEENGVTTASLFVQSVNDPANQKKYAREFKAFDLLLHNSGFANGYKDLSMATVENTFVNRKTIGNLGFYDKVKDRINYIYVKLNPAGEPAEGVAAWRLTNANGCSLFILHTCGNAFYPQPEVSDTSLSLGRIPTSSGGGGCCNMVTVETNINPIELKNDSIDRPIYIHVNFYQARIRSSGHKSDTLVSLVFHVDTVRTFRDINGGNFKLFANSSSDKIQICKDTLLKFYMHLSAGKPAKNNHPETIQFVYSDTTYTNSKINLSGPACTNKWEVALDGGVSFNTIPRFNSALIHSQTDGSHVAAALAVSRIFKPWFQLGVSATYLTLSYQDDVAYPGSVAGTYNTVTPGKPLIPVQLFGQFNIGRETGWQSNITLSAGYSFVGGGDITNSGNTLTTKPAMKGGLTAGFKMGVAYFFSCKFGLDLSFNGQYFDNKSALTNYSLFALPVTGGIRIRF